MRGLLYMEYEVNSFRKGNLKKRVVSPHCGLSSEVPLYHNIARKVKIKLVLSCQILTRSNLNSVDLYTCRQKQIHVKLELCTLTRAQRFDGTTRRRSRRRKRKRRKRTSSNSCLSDYGMY